jgi:hypothetical protein
MSPIQGVITLAKRYCLHQMDYAGNYWSYHDPKTESSYPSSVPSRALLSGYILKDLEPVTEDHFLTIAACKEWISGVAVSYRQFFSSDLYISKLRRSHTDTQSGTNAVMQNAIEDFCTYVAQITPEQACTAEPLPYERRLVATESQTVLEALKKEWQFDYFYWFPSPGDCSKPLLIFDQWNDNPFEPVKEIISRLAPQRIYRLEEGAGEVYNEVHCYEVDTSLFEPNGYEVAYAAKDFSWLVYASHEGTLVIGGDWLRAELETKLGDAIQPENRV